MNDDESTEFRIDWRGGDRARLARMRAVFLARSEDGAPAPTADYWNDRHDLELYDATFGARIGWKWDTVLAEARGRDLTPVPAGGTVVDWACGAGIATRRAAAAGLIEDGARVYLVDRSAEAREFARERVAAEAPELELHATPSIPGDGPDLLLISHVLSELGEGHLIELTRLARSAARVVWVEPGARTIARRLAGVRDGLMSSHAPLAPCPHAGACGTLAAGNDDQWCHHFPEPPQEAFIEGFWARFSKELEIDRRSLATSFIVLARRDAHEVPPDDPARARVIGRPRIEKGKATVDLCDASGVTRCELWKRDAPRVWRAWKKPGAATLDYRVERDGRRITRVIEGPGVATESEELA